MLLDNKKVHYLILLALLPAIIYLRLYDLGKASFWYDEISVTKVAANSLGQILRHIPLDKSPLYYYLLHFVEKLGGDELTLRLPAAILGMLSVIVFYFVARQLLSAPGALIATILFSFSPLHIYYSKENSPYSLYILLTLLNILLFWRVAIVGTTGGWQPIGTDRNNNLSAEVPCAKAGYWPWILLTVIDLLYVYTHNLAFIFVVIELCFLMACFRWATGGRTAIYAKRLEYYLIHLAVIAMAIIPIYRKYTTMAGGAEWWYGFPANLVADLRLMICSFTSGYLIGQSVEFSWLAILGFLLGIFYLWRQDRLKGLYLAALFFGFFAIVIVIYYAANHWLSVRYFLAPYVIYIMGLGEGIYFLCLQAQWLVKASLKKRALSRVVQGLVLLLILLSLLYWNIDFLAETPIEKTDWRGFAQYLANHPTADLTFVAASATAHFCLDYYLNKMNVDRKVYNVHDSLDDLRFLMAIHKRVVIFNWGWIRSEPELREFLSCLPLMANLSFYQINFYGFNYDHLPHRELLERALFKSYRALQGNDFQVDLGRKPGVFLDDGWCRTERWYGRFPFRWQREKEASIYFIMYAPFPNAVKMRVRSLAYPGAPEQRLTLYVNDKLAAEEVVPFDWQWLTVKVPPTALTAGLNKLTFKCQWLKVAKEVIPGSFDDRTLALALANLQFIGQ